MKTILAAIDFSPVTSAVLDEACALARAFKGRLLVVTVVEPTAIPAGPAALTLLAEIDAINQANQLSAQHKLRTLQLELRARALLVETECFKGNPGGGITDYAARVKPDYIVIGSHGHSAFHDLVLGSTAHLVLHRSTGPVVVVPAVEKKSVS